MKVASIPPPGNVGFALGDPFDARAALLLAHDDARKELYRRQVEGDRNAVLAAEWTATETAAVPVSEVSWSPTRSDRIARPASRCANSNNSGPRPG